MKKSQIYTRGGDKGETSLVSGSRISKADERINLYGDVDELNSVLGLVICVFEEKKISSSELSTFLKKIQSALFDLGSNLACESSLWEKYKLPVLKDSLITELEMQIDLMDEKLEKLKHFILPGGSKESAHAHVARTVCRRVERELIQFSINNTIPENSLIFLNRFSDYLFVLARFANLEQGISDIKWLPAT